MSLLRGDAMSEWRDISTAPRDGTRIIGRQREVGKLSDGPRRIMGKLYYLRRITWFGKTSHVPLYGWCYGKDVENVNLWNPTHWMP